MLNEKHLCKMAPRKDSINERYVNHAVLFFLMMESDFFFLLMLSNELPTSF